MKNKRAIVGYKLVIFILVILTVLAVLMLIFKADILKYFQFIPDYGTSEDKDIDADEMVDVDVPVAIFAVSIGDKNGNPIEEINFMDHFYLKVNKKNIDCSVYDIILLSEQEINTGDVVGFVPKYNSREIRLAENSEEEKISYIRTLNELSSSNYDFFLKAKIYCLNSSGDLVTSAESQIVKVITPKIIDLGFYFYEKDLVVGPPAPIRNSVEIGEDISIIVNHAGCGNIKTSLFKRIERRFWFDSKEEITGIILGEKKSNIVIYLLPKLLPGKYFASAVCKDKKERIINKKDSEKDLEIVPETTKPFLVEIVDEEGKALEKINLFSKINLKINKKEKECGYYIITPLYRWNNGIDKNWKELSQNQYIKQASLGKKETISFEDEDIKGLDKDIERLLGINRDNRDRLYSLKIKVICGDSSGKVILEGESNVVALEIT